MLTTETMQNLAAFESAGITVPHFDRAAVTRATTANPAWIHFGGGNLFRCLHASLQQRLLNAGESETGIVVVDTYDDELIETIYQGRDNLSLTVVMKANGDIEKELIASITESQYLAESNPAGTARVRAIFANPSLQLATVTITEKGYNLKGPDGELSGLVLGDIEAGPDHARHTMAHLASLLLERHRAGATPIAMVSTDNFSHNGEKLRDAILVVARAWKDRGFVDDGYLGYLTDPAKVAFPWSMIDRITPGPSASVAGELQAAGFGDTEILVTQKHTTTAPFVNTEEVNYLVVEDTFPNGRPPLEKAGVYFTDRDTVNKVERMKVCTCLNPLHTAMAIYGCLLGFTSIADETADADISALITGIGYREGLPVVTNPGIIDPKSFLDQVVGERLPNKRIPDTPQRIASDTSQKVGIRFGETIKLYRNTGAADDLTFIPLAIAGWCRYLLALDDGGEPFELSPDPMNEHLRRYVSDIRLGDPASVGRRLHPILSNRDIFGLNLYDTGLGARIEGYVEELVAGPGAVRSTLHKYASTTSNSTTSNSTTSNTEETASCK
ncbi:mannitol dehydrogenase family protein [Cryobacterium sp. RTC2.1]|uniref:mannitol dehydrogenase family protein n=2 Tax=unclassified Cryobacterium TaxID=2649013 RepID=UPI002B229E7C|nr:mannitol dehydrogenase family protein [Cryobacterium sp. RTC2.1]MEB0002938.1 mannitol dehydrogenase family protein [Cryobacterium sp. RTC2.1]